MSTNEVDLTFSRYCFIIETESERKRQIARMDRQRSSEEDRERVKESGPESEFIRYMIKKRIEITRTSYLREN